MRKDVRLALTTGLAWVGLGFVAFGCSSGQAPPVQAPAGDTSPLAACRVDETREFFCDDLLPPGSTPLSAPHPYESCPSSISSHEGVYDPTPPVATFDPGYTEYTRRRAPPGHACCYSWCSKLKVLPLDVTASMDACAQAGAFREDYCAMEPEAGSSRAAPAPFGRCPSALAPPAKAVFSAPRSAGFDAQLTQERRNGGLSLCCYAWCSKAPMGSDSAGPR